MKRSLLLTGSFVIRFKPLTITNYDVTKNIVSGRFYFTPKNDKTGKTVSITDGRFDVQFTN